MKIPLIQNKYLLLIFFFISSLFSFSRGTINILFLLVLFALCLSGFADIPLLVHVSLCIRPFSGKRTRF